ncbi:esterase-like activity of phytase family protein [Aliishimia ponticola]|uniref:Esterase-like activity of phytase family protein n=1 Tax=Aliishimia ponticola TaxID=2499833 RepID=A0A4S4N8Z0_9RHOB|nr:esterase-like activity of phytase family protein [Aliishimia ponticola]THH34817.1 esterase-like activity of phytase family protein [Aliishimia ponticola]
MLRRLTVALSVAASLCLAENDALTLSSRIVFDTPIEEFGGLSGLNIGASGTRAEVLNDRNRIFNVAMQRDAEGTLEKVFVLSSKYLYLYEPENGPDTEGLAKAPDGGSYVSVEGPTPAVLHYRKGHSWPEHLPPIPRLGIKNNNRGLEALAIDPKGRLVTLPEATPRGRDAFPIYRLENDAWHERAALPAEGAFQVVGADFGPDGHLYILERAVSLLGFRSRIRRLAAPIETARPETLLETALNAYDNLEGIALWRDAQGQTRVLMVSDNNFLSVQRTEFVEFILTE